VDVNKVALPSEKIKCLNNLRVALVEWDEMKAKLHRQLAAEMELKG
jgi:hypothetical protein